MEKVYKSKVVKRYICFCVGMTILFIGTIFLCYHSTLILLIDIAFTGIGLFLIYDMLMHTDYTIKAENCISGAVSVTNDYSYFKNQ